MSRRTKRAKRYLRYKQRQLEDAGEHPSQAFRKALEAARHRGHRL